MAFYKQEVCLLTTEKEELHHKLTELQGTICQTSEADAQTDELEDF
jgi:hypothetical protein